MTASQVVRNSVAVADPDDPANVLRPNAGGSMPINFAGSNVFAATFSAVAVSLAQDVFEIVAPTGYDVLINKIILGQYSDAGDAQAELLSVLVIRGNTVAGSGGSAATGVPLTASGANSTAVIGVNNTTPASSGSPVTLVADSWNVVAGYLWNPTNEIIVVPAGVRLAVRITAPADAITLNGTLLYQERAV